MRRAGVRLPATAVAGGAAAAYWAMMSSQSQLLGEFPRSGDDLSGSRSVALTFDDGPNGPFTTRLAAVLRARAVPATFFQVGVAIERFADTSRELLGDGHVLGNHSYSHRFRRCFAEADQDEEIRRAQDVFGEHLAITPRLYRPPWLLRTASTFRVLRARGLTAVSGTFCHPLEVAQIPSRRIAARAVARTRPGRMIIFHDGYNGNAADRSRTVDAVAAVVDDLLEDGYTFTTVDRLLGVNAYDESVAT